MTKEGPGQNANQGNKQCVFPWTFNNDKNKTYYGCDNPDTGKKTAAWCPTQKAFEKNVTNINPGGKRWGYCKMDYEGGNCTSPGMCGIYADFNAGQENGLLFWI